MSNLPCRLHLPGLLLTYCFLLFLLPSELAAQSLQQLRDEVRNADLESSSDDDDDDPSPRKKHTRDSYDGHSACDDIDDDCGLTQSLATVAGWVITMPYWGPVKWTNDSYAKTGYFPAFPYQHDFGYMMFNPEEAHGVPGPRQPFPWAVRARTDYGTNFSGLDWIGGHVLVESTPRMGLESDFRFYQDNVGTGQPDSAWLGDANVFFRFAQSEQVQMRSGIGINYLSDRQQSDIGFNFTYAGDYYPIKPWVISGEFDWGLLGDEQLLHVRMTTGLQYGGLEAFVGYDFLDIGKFQTNSLVGGLRIWF
jgi:hypothetical protein